MPIWRFAFPQASKVAANLVVIFQVLSMRVAQSQGGGMRTDSMFLLIPGFWVFATGGSGSEPETEARTTLGA